MDLSNISDELQEKVRECSTPEEMLALVANEGVELNDEQLEQIAGGAVWERDELHCPECNSTRVSYDSFLCLRICQDCGYEF